MVDDFWWHNINVLYMYYHLVINTNPDIYSYHVHMTELSLNTMGAHYIYSDIKGSSALDF